MYRIVLTVFLLGASTLSFPAVAADTENCAAIADDAKRLNCYDQQGAEPAGPAPGSGIWEQRILKDADRETFTLTALKPNYFTYSYLDDPNPSTVLVMTAAKVDKRIKFFAAAKKKRFLCELQVPRQAGSSPAS